MLLPGDGAVEFMVGDDGMARAGKPGGAKPSGAAATARRSLPTPSRKSRGATGNAAGR